MGIMENTSIAASIQQFIQDLIENEGMFTVDSTEQRRIHFEFSVEYNAVRILLLTKYCGDKEIDSKLKLAFFDFLLRYPICLKYLLDKNDIKENFSHAELTSIDKKMVKHISSAWDPDYYNYLGFLEARGLIEVDYKEKFEIKLTPLGDKISEKLEFPECYSLIRRCKIIRKVFEKKTDAQIDKVIHANFAFVMLYDR